MGEYKITSANIKEWAKNYKGPLFDGILCDPPYELGFMGKSWDSSGIAFDVEMWQDIFKLLKPGGHLLAFSGSRTYHRMAVAIEDAGFEIRDQLIWMYGSGFPKSHNIGKNIEKIKVGGIKNLKQVGAKKGIKVETGTQGFSYSKEYVAGKSMGGKQISGDIPVYEINNEYNGYGTALKPAHEPCVLARKPLDKGMTVAGNVLKHGTGGLNIDGTRVGMVGNDKKVGGFGNGKIGFGGGDAKGVEWQEQTTGRFPANLIHDGSDEVEAVFPQTGKGNGGKPFSYSGQEYDNKDSSMFNGDKPQAPSNFNDSGSASRFFYTAKASKSERNAGLEGFEERTTQGMRENAGPALVGEDRVRTQTANFHPTVKPLSLTKYLATLIKPPTGGRLLVPFSGSGSEMIGALQAGWGYVEGVELTEEYIPIAEARIKYWLSRVEEEDKQEVLL